MVWRYILIKCTTYGNNILTWNESALDIIMHWQKRASTLAEINVSAKLNRVNISSNVHKPLKDMYTSAILGDERMDFQWMGAWVMGQRTLFWDRSGQVSDITLLGSWYLIISAIRRVRVSNYDILQMFVC